MLSFPLCAELAVSLYTRHACSHKVSLYTRHACSHKVSLYTRRACSHKVSLYTRRACSHKVSLYTRHACSHKVSLYTRHACSHNLLSSHQQNQCLFKLDCPTNTSVPPHPTPHPQHAPPNNHIMTSNPCHQNVDNV